MWLEKKQAAGRWTARNSLAKPPREALDGPPSTRQLFALPA